MYSERFLGETPTVYLIHFNELVASRIFHGKGQHNLETSPQALSPFSNAAPSDRLQLYDGTSQGSQTRLTGLPACHTPGLRCLTAMSSSRPDRRLPGGAAGLGDARALLAGQPVPVGVTLLGHVHHDRRVLVAARVQLMRLACGGQEGSSEAVAFVFVLFEFRSFRTIAGPGGEIGPLPRPK